MSRIRPECADSDPSDRSAAADALLRQEPDEEEDEEEDEGTAEKMPMMTTKTTATRSERARVYFSG